MCCSYTQHVWFEVIGIIGFACIWIGDSIEKGLKNPYDHAGTKEFRAFLVMVAWDLWLVKNSSLLEDKMTHPLVVAIQIMNIMKSFKQQRILKTLIFLRGT